MLYITQTRVLKNTKNKNVLYPNSSAKHFFKEKKSERRKKKL